MGCCLSKTQDSLHTPKPPPTPPLHRHPQRFYVSDPHRHRTKAPPLPLSPPVEEETVKEVLSETPTIKPPPIAKINEPKVPNIPKTEEDKKTSDSPVTVPASLAETEEEKKKELPKVHVQVEFSEDFSSSEICTASESISTTTTFTTNTEKRGGEDEDEDEDGEVQQRLLHRSPSKIPKKGTFPNESMSRQERGRKSQARRSDPSPGKRNYAIDVGQTGRRRVSESNLNRPRRDPGECSGRRSRSPATRVNAGNTKPTFGHSPSRRFGRSPAGFPAAPPPEKEKNQKAEEPNEGNPRANESIENPLVSLECFIFL